MNLDIISAIPVDTGRKLSVHKMFARRLRRRLRRLMDVLWTFNLRPVSTIPCLRGCTDSIESSVCSKIVELQIVRFDIKMVNL